MANTEQLSGGNYYGTIRGKKEHSCAIFTDLCHTSARKLPAHAHELAFFAVVLSGGYGERYGHCEKQFGPFSLMFRPAGIPHQDEIGPRGATFFEIELRPFWQTILRDCSATLDHALDDCVGGDLLWLGMKLFRETRGPGPASDLAVESLLAELVGIAARLPRETTNDAPRWLRRVVEKLEAEYCQRLTLDQLSREAGVHPVHLSRVFRRCMGEGMGEYVHRRRIRAACEQMLEPGRPLCEIALATGFADQSHFTHMFRRITGINPGAFREIAARPEAGSATTSYLLSTAT